MTPLWFKALDFSEIITELLLYPKSPYQWDVKQQIFVGEVNHRRLVSWYFGVWFSAVFVGNLSFFYLVIWKGLFFNTPLPSDHLFFIALIFTLGTTTDTISYSVFQSRMELADYQNLIVDLYKQINPHVGKNGYNQHKLAFVVNILKETITEMKQIFKTGKGDFVGVGIIAIVSTASVAPLIYFAGTLTMRLDPISYTVSTLIKDWPPTPKFLGYLLAALVAGFPGFEMSRIFITIAIFATVSPKVTLSKLRKIELLSNQNVSQAIGEYELLQAIHVKRVKAGKNIMFWCIECGMLLVIVSLTGAFVGAYIFSPLIYWLFPLTAGCALSMFPLALINGISEAELSETLLKRWKMEVVCVPGNRMYNRKKLESLWPLGFYADNFGNLRGETKTQIYETIITKTVDMLMLFKAKGWMKPKIN